MATASSCPRVQPTLSCEEIAAQIGQALNDQFDGVPAQSQRVMIPVEFYGREQ
jgi:hypothetical protein